MNKIKNFIILALIFLFVVVSVNAQDYTDYTIKNQWYEAVYDESNTATVNAVFNIFNKGFGDKSLETFKIQVSQGNIEILEIVQIVGSGQKCEQVCVKYDQVCTGTEVVCKNFDSANNQCLDWEERCKGYRSECSSYEERCSDTSYTNDYNKDYKLLDKNQVQKSGNIYEIPIIPISSGDSSKLLVRYKLLNTVNKLLYNSFTFESLKVPVETEELRIAINTDNDLHLSGTKSSRSFGGFGMFGAVSGMASSVDIQDKSDYYQIFNRIQYASGYVKERRNLDAGHTLIMKGKYSSSRIILNLFEIILFFALTIGVLIFWSKWVTSIDEKHKQILDAKKLKDLKDFHVWRAIGLSFIGIFSFILFLVISLFMTNSYLKSIILSLAFIGIIGTLIFTKKIHSTKEMLASIGFFFMWVVVVPFVLQVLFFILMIFGAFIF